jgi:MFS family permease
MSRESSLRAQMVEGIFASVMFGFTVNYFTPFGLLLGAGSFAIGLVNAVPQLCNALGHLVSAGLVRLMHSRVKVVSPTVLFQGATLFVMSVLFLMPVSVRVPVFVFLVGGHALFGAFGGPAWASLMSDTVDKREYGRFFARRGLVFGVVNFAANAIAGILLYVVPEKMYGFVGLLFLAGVCRVISGIYLGRMDDIPIAYSPEKHDFSYWQFIRRLRESNFVRFVLFVSLFNAGAFLAAPFFAVYMLNELHLSYAVYTAVTSATALTSLLTLPLWGHLADRHGNAVIIKATACLIPALPVLWLVSPNPVYLVALNLFGGYLWAGFNLAAGNYIFDAASPEVRTRCVGYFNFTNGMLVFGGALAGGFLAEHLPGLAGFSTLQTLFLVSGAVRLAVVLLLVRSFGEVRPVERIASRDFLSLVMGFAPLASLGSSIYEWIKIPWRRGRGGA